LEGKTSAKTSIPSMQIIAAYVIINAQIIQQTMQLPTHVMMDHAHTNAKKAMSTLEQAHLPILSNALTHSMIMNIVVQNPTKIKVKTVRLKVVLSVPVANALNLVFLEQTYAKAHASINQRHMSLLAIHIL
jgi:hypothetical protein